MSSAFRNVFLVCACSLVFAAQAQQRFIAHVAYVYPAGGRQGTTFTVKVGGQYLEGVTNAIVSGAAVRATVIDYSRPLTQKQINDSRERLRELQKEGGPAARKEMLELRKQVVASVKRLSNPAFAEQVTLRITISKNVEAGQHDLRLITANSVSNPLRFFVGDLPEYQKPEPLVNEDPKNFREIRENQIQAAPPTETRVTVPSVVNGQLPPGGVDRFRFSARKGQQFVAVAKARSLIPYLADAVPGWFQATLTMYDSKGKEIAYNDDFNGQPDPVIYIEIPCDGEYVVEIKDSIYRGRDDFVYRIEMGELPFITGIYPLGGKAGQKTTVHLSGWNLPEKTAIVKPTAGATHAPILVTKNGHVSNPVFFAVDALPETNEREPNNFVRKAQRVTLPVVVNGRIGSAGDSDVFALKGKVGDEIVAEVCAHRLGSPLDSVLKLTDESGNQVAFNDDCEDKACGLITHHADSYLRTKLPTDGTYYIHLSDAQQKGGDDYAYRLRISAPQPDFQVRVAPAQIMVRPGLSTPMTVYAIRKDGFLNDIDIVLRNAPDGLKLHGGTIPAGQDSVQVTISAANYLGFKPTNILLEAHASNHGKIIVRDVVPAEDMMQAFAYHHLVPAQNLTIALAPRGLPRGEARVLTQTPVKIPAGGTASISLRLPVPKQLENRFKLELSSPPEGISIAKIVESDDKTEILVRSDGKVKTGLQGNLIVVAVASRTPANAKKKGNEGKWNVGALPAIPFEVVEPKTE